MARLSRGQLYGNRQLTDPAYAGDGGDPQRELAKRCRIEHLLGQYGFAFSSCKALPLRLGHVHAAELSR